jgi:uncharacterized damage-inducible protein DinB
LAWPAGKRAARHQPRGAGRWLGGTAWPHRQHAHAGGRCVRNSHAWGRRVWGLLALPAGARHETELHADWAALRAQRERLDAAIEAWLAALPADFPQSTMRYSNTKGVQREHPMWQALTHFFNHQTHHRGQVTTLLMQAGVDVGVTDLIALV